MALDAQLVNLVFVKLTLFGRILLQNVVGFLVVTLAMSCVYLASRCLKQTFGARVKPHRDKAILITGATSGFGLVLAKHFYKLGFTVFAGYYNDREPGYKELVELRIKQETSLQESMSSSSSRGLENTSDNYNNRLDEDPYLFLLPMDVRSADSINNAATEIERLLDKHNLSLFRLINNAGISGDCSFEWVSQKTICNTLETNLLGTMLVTRRLIYRIIACRGRVVNVSTGVFLTPAAIMSVYGTSKCAVAYFSDALNCDLAPYGASSCCVIPGNFLSSSNIIFSRLKSIEDSVSCLSQHELRLYKRSIDANRLSATRLLKLKLDKNSDDQKTTSSVTVANIYDVTVPDTSADFSKSLSQKFMSKIDGSSVGRPLEESGVVEGFSASVLMASPPARVFAGTWMYQMITGPVVELLPSVAVRNSGEILAKPLRLN